MSNVSDMIEAFLIDTMGEDSTIDISRNELANYFNVAPSQINYVLTTRFNFERGFVTQSKRGGSGYITLSRAEKIDSKWFKEVVTRLNEDIDYRSATYILEEMENHKLISPAQKEILLCVVSPQALANPFRLENKIRANILRKVLGERLRRG